MPAKVSMVEHEVDYPTNTYSHTHHYPTITAIAAIAHESQQIHPSEPNGFTGQTARRHEIPSMDLSHQACQACQCPGKAFKKLLEGLGLIFQALVSRHFKAHKNAPCILQAH